MIRIFVNIENYIPDVQPLVRAFYHDEEVRILKEDPGNDRDVLRVLFPQTVQNEVLVFFREREYRERPVLGEVNASGLDSSDKVAIRNCAKRLLYSALSEDSKRELPWGVLTGIRPTRIALTRLNNGMPEDDIKAFMKKAFLVSDEKIELALDIAKREKSILDRLDTKSGFSLYIGIPFCPTTCLYCSFASNPIHAWRDRVDEYLDALELELKESSKICQGRTLDTVYVGGGTPTTLEAYQLRRLLGMCRQYFDMSSVKELTVESGRPDSITMDKLLALKEFGVTRISINPQTFKDDTLKIIGRHHTSQQTIEAFRLARSAGFDNINMDLILGLPGESIEDVRATLSVVRELKPESLTVHSLALKRASGLSEWMEKNGTEGITNSDEMVASCASAAADLGLDPYYLYRQKNMAGNFENVGYARSDVYGLYNILMMEEVQTIIACGAGTITKRLHTDGQLERCDNVKDVNLYISKIEEMIERKRELFKD